MFGHQSNGTLTDFRGKLVAPAHDYIFSGNAASSKPGVIHGMRGEGLQGAELNSLIDEVQNVYNVVLERLVKK